MRGRKTILNAAMLLAAGSAHADVISCPPPEGEVLEEINDQSVPFQGSELLPISRIESTNSPIISLYNYCIRNDHAYTSAFAEWLYEGDTYFVHLRPVPAQGERYENHRRVYEKYAGKHDVSYGISADSLNDSRPVDTLGWKPVKHAASEDARAILQDNDQLIAHLERYGTLSLGTVAVVDIPITETVGAALAEGKYGEYKPDDFVTTTLSFSSDAAWEGGLLLSHQLTYLFEEEEDGKRFLDNDRAAFVRLVPSAADLRIAENVPRAEQGIPFFAHAMQEAGLSEIPSGNDLGEIIEFPDGIWFQHTIGPQDVGAINANEGHIEILDESGNPVARLLISYWSTN